MIICRPPAIQQQHNTQQLHATCTALTIVSACLSRRTPVDILKQITKIKLKIKNIKKTSGCEGLPLTTSQLSAKCE